MVGALNMFLSQHFTLQNILFVNNNRSIAKRNLFKITDPFIVKVNLEVTKMVVFGSLPISIADSIYFSSA
jgi:hypothetical protein